MVEENAKSKIFYRYLGNSGLKVSCIGYGNYLNSITEDKYIATRDCIKAMFDAGVNFFDSAEVMASAACAEMMGRAFKELELRREDLVVTAKIFSSGMKPNDCFHSRKHIIEGVQAHLKRMQLDYVDVVFCHKQDNDTPIEETCRAMHQLVENGLSFYWGTSDWSAARVEQAIAFCEAKKLHKPIVEQPEYNMITRDIMEKEYRDLFISHGHGIVAAAPLASGLLTGKYNDGGIPEGSRYSSASFYIKMVYGNYLPAAKKDAILAKFVKLADLAKELDVTQAQLSLAWVLVNTSVSVAVVGVSSLAQVEENLKAIELYHKWTPEIDAKVEAILENKPDAVMDFNSSPWVPIKGQRAEALLKEGRDHKN